MRIKPSKLAAVCAVVFLLISIGIVIVVPTADQYEISIYTAYPTHFWVVIAGSQLAGCLAIVSSVRRPNDRSWTFGFITVLMASVLLFALPVVRGYEMYGRTDAMTHLGLALDIINYGITPTNFYPPAHLLSLAVSDAAGIGLRTAMMLLPVVFWVVYLGSMAYLIITLFDTRGRILFGLSIAVLPVFTSVGLRPFDLSIALVPLTLYLFFRSQRQPLSSFRVMFVIALVANLVYHPLTAAFLTGIFFIYSVGRRTTIIRNRYVSPTNLFSLSAAVFLAWYSGFLGIIRRFNEVYRKIFGIAGGEPPVAAYTETVQRASPDPLDIARVTIVRYGAEAALFSLGFVFVVLTLLSVHRGKEDSVDTHTLLFAAILTLFSLASLVFLFVELPAGHVRPLKMAKIGGLVLTGQLLYLVWQYLSHRTHHANIYAEGVIVVILTLLVILSMINLFPAPFGSSANQHVTEMEMEGTQWVTEVGDADNGMLQFDMSYTRFYEAQYGRNASKPFYGQAPPRHFNYSERQYIGQSVSEDSYLIINRRGRIFYPEVFPQYRESWGYTPADFAQLERDRTAIRIYDNGDYNQYLVDDFEPETQT